MTGAPPAMPLRVLALGLHRKFHADPKPRYCLIARKMWDPRLSAVSPAIADLNAEKLKGGESLGNAGLAATYSSAA